jgi:hypothetical protein
MIYYLYSIELGHFKFTYFFCLTLPRASPQPPPKEWEKYKERVIGGKFEMPQSN